MADLGLCYDGTMTLDQAVWRSPNRVSGALCFRGTRVPVRTLFDHLQAGELEAFFEDFPDVSREAVRAVLEASARSLETNYREPAA